MEKKDLLKFCRYYDGKKENGILGAYEKKFIEDFFDTPESIDEKLSNYAFAGLSMFNADDGVPATLKAYLYDRFLHFGGDAESFKTWYKEVYLK